MFVSETAYEKRGLSPLQLYSRAYNYAGPRWARAGMHPNFGRRNHVSTIMLLTRECYFFLILVMV